MMALKKCSCSVTTEMVGGEPRRTYSLYIENGGPYPSSNEATDLDLDDLKFLERELKKSIDLEKLMNNEH